MNEKLTDLNALHQACLDCSRLVSWKESVQRYQANEFLNLIKLKDSLLCGTYKQRPFNEFTIMERGKARNVKALIFEDRVLQRVLCDKILNPALQPYLIYDNGACIKGKGIDFCRRRVKCHLQKYYRKFGHKAYVLKMDFTKYFDSVPHAKLCSLMADKIKDPCVMALVEYLINSTGEAKGLGIGSQLSQTAGVFYSSPIDNYCKIVRGCKFYDRYMDDAVILSPDRPFLEELKTELEKECGFLGLALHPKKTYITRLESGFEFLKRRYILTSTGKIKIIPLSETFRREKRKLRRMAVSFPQGLEEQYISWRGTVAGISSYRALRRIDKYYNARRTSAK